MGQKERARGEVEIVESRLERNQFGICFEQSGGAKCYVDRIDGVAQDGMDLLFMAVRRAVEFVFEDQFEGRIAVGGGLFVGIDVETYIRVLGVKSDVVQH